MEKADVLAYRDRWKVVAEIEAQERRTASIQTRWKQLNAILRLAIGLGLPLKPDENKLIVYQRWAIIKHSFEDTKYTLDDRQ
jgi:hypothetical protein